MKTKKKQYFTVAFTNGKKEDFYCDNFDQAIVLAMAYAIRQSWNMRLQYVTNSKGEKITNIQFPKFINLKSQS